MNFMERLEEGLGEEQDVTRHTRVSAYQKRSESGDPSESFLTEDTGEMAKSTVVGSINEDIESADGGKVSLPGYSHIDDSYF